MNFWKTISTLVLGVISLSATSGHTNPYQLWTEGDNTFHTIRPLKEVEGFSDVSEMWKVTGNAEKNTYQIIGFPGYKRADGTKRDVNAYCPEGLEDPQNLILTQSTDSNFLDNLWAPYGLSSHAIINHQGMVVLYADPLKNQKGQMAATWNKNSLEVALVTQEDHVASDAQITALNNLMGGHWKEFQKHVTFCGDILQARNPTKEKGEDGQIKFDAGRIDNIDKIRKAFPFLQKI